MVTTIDIYNPATGNVVGSVENMNKEVVENVIQKAYAAFLQWRKETPKARANLLRKWNDLILENTDSLAKILTTEQGKPLSEAKREIQYGASFVEWFAEEAKRIYGDEIPAPVPNHHIVVIKQPVGVVGAITPWNFPCAMITRKVAPALAAGCAVVLKPSSLTPLTAIELIKLAIKAGIPEGVINIVTGDAKSIGDIFTKNELIRKISFTGSTEIGKQLMAQCASTIKKISLELGGNAPFIIFDDADIDAAVTGVIASKFRNMGQTCVCANRIFVQENIYDLFVDKLTEAVKKLRVGDGLTDVEQGPLINEAAVKKVESHIQDAVEKGAKILCGGKRDKLGKTYFEPTVLRDVTMDMLCAHEETFGPMAPVFSFHDEVDVIHKANATQYGLSTYFYSQNIHRVWRVAEQLEYGMVGINSGTISTEFVPFGGVKESGIGREGSKYGIHEFVEIKTLYMGS
ncbi:MAG: NAD-dependent succinate-semialdehyde dehydrogenase [Gammaproteobacteria bacterium]|nr:NAD-dependent succinate-semialdehyde dehydrogenase [Gammaproteobacteria bacterium]